MIKGRVNLRDELALERKKSDANDILLQVRQILADQEAERNRIRGTIDESSGEIANAFTFDLLETDRIFHVSHIRKVCIDYRLRFLDSQMFRHEFPDEAITQIRTLEQKHGTDLGGFRIIAPTKAFHLHNYNDPLLFVPIGNDYYYLIHQWGN